MYAQQDRSSEHAQEMRKRGGTYLRSLREQAGLTQRDLAEKVGFKYYTFVLQIECGTGRVPPQDYKAYAAAVHVDLKTFVKKIMMFYDPFTYEALFGVPTDRELPE